MPHSSVLSGRGGGPPRRLTALNDGGEGQDSVQMIDLTIVRAHQHSAGDPKKKASKHWVGPAGDCPQSSTLP